MRVVIASCGAAALRKSSAQGANGTRPMTLPLQNAEQSPLANFRVTSNSARSPLPPQNVNSRTRSSYRNQADRAMSRSEQL
jgi:hypothetical protein